MPPPKKGSDNRDVLSGLPRSRPQRPSARREKARASAAKAKPVAAAAGSAKPAAKPKAAARPKTAAAAAKPKAPPAGYATPQPATPATQDHGLVSTAIQAAGEIVQIGATVGSQALKAALRRIPRP
jgi:hypothetical protein